MNASEERLDKLIEGMEKRPRMYFVNNDTFLLCYSNAMYLKLGIGMSIILEKLSNFFGIELQDDFDNYVYDSPSFKEDIKIFRRTLENIIFE
jgi:hypothetical protein